MSKTFAVRMVDADEEIFVGDVVSLSATALNGELGILAGHTPLMAVLKPGQIRLKMPNDNEEVLYISGGFLEVQPEQTIVLADGAERAESLDEEKIKLARQRAENAMRDKSASKLDHARAHAELIQTAAQMAALRRSKKNN